LGFRALRERWQAAPRFDPPVPTEQQAQAWSEALADDFASFLEEPGARAFLEDEAARRLARLVAWTTRRRTWMP
jgi:hypothetical protein